MWTEVQQEFEMPVRAADQQGLGTTGLQRLGLTVGSIRQKGSNREWECLLEMWVSNDWDRP